MGSTTKPCVCKIEGDGNPWAPRIIYCDTHEAAFDNEAKAIAMQAERDEAIRTTAQTTEALKANNEQRAALLAALKEIADWKLPGEPDVYECRRIARAALAKAKGESQERLDSTTRLGKAMVDATRLERNEARRWDQ